MHSPTTVTPTDHSHRPFSHMTNLSQTTSSNHMTAQISGYACLEKGQPLTKWAYTPRDLGPEDVEIKISHCGICSSDIHTLESGWSPSIYPLIVGHEIVGIVTKKGANVTHLQEGDRVGVGAQVWACLDAKEDCGECKQGIETLCSKRVFTYNDKYQDGGVAYGGYAEAVRCSSHFSFKIPDNIPSEYSAPLLCAGLTVFTPLKRYNVKAGTKCGIVGIGGLGHLAIQFASVMGGEVYAISHTANKKDLSLKLGATTFVDMEHRDTVQSVEGTLDVVLLTANYDGMDIGKYLSLLKPRGTLIMVGIPNSKLSVDCKSFIFHEKIVRGSLIGTPQEMKEMLKVASEHKVFPMIEKMPMSKVNEGLALVEANKVRFRVVLENE